MKIVHIFCAYLQCGTQIFTGSERLCMKHVLFPNLYKVLNIELSTAEWGHR
jgi:hypothetical protein